MSRTEMLSSLNLMTLVVVAAIVAIGFALFMRRRSNRHPLEGRQERNIARDLDEGNTPPDHSPRS